MNRDELLEAFKELIEKYRGKKHPLDYRTLYQLVVMVLLSAQDSDKHINQIAPPLFEEFPDMTALAKATEDRLIAHIGKVRNFQSKTSYLLKLARMVQSDDRIPQTHKTLTELPGIGPKSANVILRETGKPAEGIIVDLHVLRVVPRIGLSQAQDGNKMERELKAFFPADYWGEVGMAISFLGREICRPTAPKCSLCPMSSVCQYRNQQAL